MTYDAWLEEPYQRNAAREDAYNAIVERGMESGDLSPDASDDEAWAYFEDILAGEAEAAAERAAEDRAEWRAEMEAERDEW